MQLRVALTTWNVGGAAQAPGGVPADARALLRGVDSGVDVAVVGLQEVPWPGRGWKAALLAGLADRRGEDDDAGAGAGSGAGACAGSGAGADAGASAGAGAGAGAGADPAAWRVCTGCRYLGMRVVVLVRERARDRVVALRAMRVGSGVADRFPNKGAVAVELALDKTTTACFVVAHLAAQEGNLREREEDWINIVRRLQNEDTVAADGINVPLFMRYDHVFVMGDLNYRLVPRVGSTLPDRVAWVEDRVRAADWPALAAVDELGAERAIGHVFVNFHEGPLNFPPTFKYEPGAAKYNSARVPSYCDRVLWHSLPARSAMVQLDSYTTLNDIMASDHRPVRAVVDVLTPPAPQRMSLHSTGGMRIVLEFSFVRLVRYKTDPKRKKRRQRKRSQRDNSDARRHVTAMQTSAASTPTAALTSLPDGQVSGTGTALLRTMFLDSGESDGQNGTAEAADDDDDDDDHFSSSSSSSGSSSDTEAGGSGDSDDAEICSEDDDYENRPPSWTGDQLAAAALDKDVFLERHLASNESVSTPTPPAFVGIGKASPSLSLKVGDKTNPWGTGPEISTKGSPHRPEIGDQLPPEDIASSDGDDVSGLLSCELRALDLGSGRPVPRPVAIQAGGEHLSAGSLPGQFSALRRSSHSRSHSNPVSSHSLEIEKYAMGQSTYNPVKREMLTTSLVTHRPEVQSAGDSKRGRKHRKAKAWLMDIHGSSVFLDSSRVYRAEIPKRRNGSHECGSECLPAIPFMPVQGIQDLQFEHLQISFWRAKSRMGLSGVLPLSMLLEDPLEPYSFELKLTKYGREAGLLEACVRLVVSDSRLWVDSQGHVVRTASGLPSKFYLGPLAVRKKARKGGRFSSQAAKTAQSARAVTKIIARKLDSLGSDKS